ncbi:MAG TPA: cobalamin-binding protein [Roseiflexaceae bacterium]|nr:cobalamin-binding protein [Roseiflexaceae bacterium]
MRIVSLLPSATEIVFALGLGDALVGVTHECDYPAPARALPVVTSSLLDHADATSAEIDHAVSGQLGTGLGLYGLDEQLLAELKPDLILTQSLCEVCAVSFGTVQRAVRDVTPGFPGVAPQILSLEPSSLDDILTTISLVGAATGAQTRAEQLVAELRARIEQVRVRALQASRAPRVACLEWVDPLFGPGHWLPEMVALAGGTPGLGIAHTDSRRVSWSDVIAFAPEVMVVSPCGFDLRRALDEALRVLPYRAGWEALPAVRAGRVSVVDGNAYFSRPGPRIVDSLELLARLIHPELFAGWGPSEAWAPLVGHAPVPVQLEDAAAPGPVAAPAGLPTEE